MIKNYDEYYEDMNEDKEAQTHPNNRVSIPKTIEITTLDFVKMNSDIREMKAQGATKQDILNTASQGLTAIRQTIPRTRNSMKRHAGSIPMPSPSEEMDLYSKRSLFNNETEIPLFKILNISDIYNINPAPIAPPKKTIKFRLGSYIAIKLLALAIFVCKKTGVQ